MTEENGPEKMQEMVLRSTNLRDKIRSLLEAVADIDVRKCEDSEALICASAPMSRRQAKRE